MLVFIAGLHNIPEPLYEAAKIDGAGPLQSFRHITLPLIMPTMLFVVVTQFIAHMQVFAQPYIITAGGPGNASRSVVLYLYETAWKYFRFGYASAISVVLARDHDRRDRHSILADAPPHRVLGQQEETHDYKHPHVHPDRRADVASQKTPGGRCCCG